MSDIQKVRIGIIGLGSMGVGHIDRIKNVSNIQLVAVCDTIQAIAEAEEGIKSVELAKRTLNSIGINLRKSPQK